MQVSEDVYNSKEPFDTEWRRTKIEGEVPIALKLSEWALGPANGRPDDNGKYPNQPWYTSINQFFRTLIIAVPLQIFLALPMVVHPWEEDEVDDNYLDWPGYHWKWPKYAVNPLDMQPEAEVPQELLGTYFSWKTRLVQPRLLVVLEGGQWITKDLTGYTGQDKPYSYVFLSYTNKHWFTNSWNPGWEERRKQLERIAEGMALDAGLNAYWMDFKCRSDEPGPLLDSDVNRFCDIIRGAKKIVVSLPGNRPEQEEMKVLGDRMWTLPEGLLATGDMIYFHNAKTSTSTGRTKLEMTADVWNEQPRTDKDVQSTRVLAEHFTGSLTLGRLELFSIALEALGKRQAMERRPDERPELAYGTVPQHRPCLLTSGGLTESKL